MIQRGIPVLTRGNMRIWKPKGNDMKIQDKEKWAMKNFRFSRWALEVSANCFFPNLEAIPFKVHSIPFKVHSIPFRFMELGHDHRSGSYMKTNYASRLIQAWISLNRHISSIND
jgi:hypothetical protein